MYFSCFNAQQLTSYDRKLKYFCGVIICKENSSQYAERILTENENIIYRNQIFLDDSILIENSYAAIEYTLTVRIVPSVQQMLSLLMVPTNLVENSLFFQLFFQLFQFTLNYSHTSTHGLYTQQTYARYHGQYPLRERNSLQLIVLSVDTLLCLQCVLSMDTRIVH